MLNKITPDIQAVLDAQHCQFRNAQQAESATYAALVEKGHPLTPVYKEVRVFFDSLKYACEVSGRRFSYAGMYENSGYEAPTLGLTWWPPEELSSCCAFLHPGHCQWPRYVDAAAKAGWPENSAPELRPGVWRIRTQKQELLQALLALSAGREDMKFTSTYDRENNPYSHLIMVTESVYASGSNCSRDALRLHKAIMELLMAHHEGYILPRQSTEHPVATECSP